jgi:hypothetical protein
MSSVNVEPAQSLSASITADIKVESSETIDAPLVPVVPDSVAATLATFPEGLNDKWNKTVFNFMNKVRDSGVYNMMGSEGLVKHVKRELNCERVCAEDFVREYCMDFDKLESFYKDPAIAAVPSPQRGTKRRSEENLDEPKRARTDSESA